MGSNPIGVDFSHVPDSADTSSTVSTLYEPPRRFPTEKSETEWKETLTAEEYKVIRKKGTERPFTGEYDKLFPKADEGHFVCRACANPLYPAEAKYNSGCGWPAFIQCYKGGVATATDRSHGVVRIEILCASCGGHLGHVFSGERGPDTERHCVNSVSVRFVKSTDKAIPSTTHAPVLGSSNL